MKVILYASGDGALHFVSRDDNKNVDSRRPTIEECIDALAGDPDNEHLYKDGWRIVIINTLLCAVAPIKRVNEDTLEVKGMIFNYTLDPKYVHKDGEVGDSAMNITFDHDILGKTEVKNWSLRSQIRHFLNHEKELVSQPWISIPFVHCGQDI